jgi:hypothetical protein
MTENHPITVPQDLLREWNEEALSIPDPLGWSKYIATQASELGGASVGSTEGSDRQIFHNIFRSTRTC